MAKRPNNTKIIAVIGGQRAGKAALRQAEEVGRLIARAGAVLVTGGLSGVMEAASRGAHAEGGITLGILPHDGKEHANEYVNVPVATGLGIGRNVIIARTADGVVAVGGEYGTLSEIAFSLQLGKPVAGIGSWDIKGMMSARDAKDAVSKVLKALE